MDNFFNSGRFEEFFDTAEENRAMEMDDIKKSLSLQNLLLFIVAIALVFIALNQGLDFLIKIEIIQTSNDILKDLHQLLN